MKEAGAAASKQEVAAALKRAVALANADPGKLALVQHETRYAFIC